MAYLRLAPTADHGLAGDAAEAGRVGGTSIAPVVVDPKAVGPAIPYQAPPSSGTVIETIVDDVTIRAVPGTDEAHLARVIRSARAAAR
ncbi:hypothetical protein ACFPOC_02265 [Rubellimicrobium aerolatum]|uniref:Uncharacterized protein n=1 Tax=Rubellimicrobium aerolatum TaxID=490979 RepID=A0ABW0S8K7_9RHOB|nr:hypothetical protein [Rubellimicrobium aerolatum]